MSTTILLLIITITIAISFTFLLFTETQPKNKKTSSFPLPPSPPSLPILGHLHLLKPPIHLSLAHLYSRYGPILLRRFGLLRNVLLVSSHSLAEECFTKNDLAFATRSLLASSERLSYNYTTLIAALCGLHCTT